MQRKDNNPQGDEEIPDPRNWQVEESVYIISMRRERNSGLFVIPMCTGR